MIGAPALRGARRHGGWTRALCLLGMLPAGAAMAEAMRVAAGSANSPPFVLYSAEGQLTGGIARDLMDALAARLGIAVSYLDLPRARVEPWLRDGEVDAACFLAPAWVQQPEALRWSPVLFEIQQVVVQPAAAKPARLPDDLFGLRIGTQLNYVYPELQPWFANARMQRHDAASLDANLGKLLVGRIDALIDVDTAVFYRQETSAQPLPIRVGPLWAPPSPVHCAFNAEFVAAHPTLLDTLQAMLGEGRVSGWVDHYTGGRRAQAPSSTP